MDANIFNFRLSALRNQNRDVLQRGAFEKAAFSRDPLKNMQNNSFLHSNYSQSGYSFFNQLNQIASLGNGPKPRTQERQHTLLAQRCQLKETQCKILDYHMEQMSQRAKDHEEIIKRLKVNRCSLSEQREVLKAQCEEQAKTVAAILEGNSQKMAELEAKIQEEESLLQQRMQETYKQKLEQDGGIHKSEDE
jgi:curved DNA-binding protein CbpA